jgi:hypothetical protein
MDEQVRKLEAYFKRTVVSQDKDDGDDNSFEKYWEFIHPSKVEY